MSLDPVSNKNVKILSINKLFASVFPCLHVGDMLLSHCSFVCIGGLFLIIVREVKDSGVYLTL